ncbi:melanin-concentrating hormone receptor 2 [Leucoraja erinacea]|uniref:melanin-concentrating hormone receptor 2 n=1 Tax=Leucoraja erinaceus TaxID=7782 RepID=UPI002456610D|nr:melanin-concentrating hormone receptor 2 [Leucoraja erinacea]
MNRTQTLCWAWYNGSEWLNKSTDIVYDNQMIDILETILLPSCVGIICSTGLVGNILILFTIIRSVRRTIPDIYICNLAMADLVHVLGMPFLIHQWARGGEWVLGSTLCTITTSLDSCNQFACCAIMAAMSLDRYLALVHPFHLTSFRTRSKTIKINLCLWAISLVLVLPVWMHAKVITFKDGLESCAFDLTSPRDILWYTLYHTITSFFVPLPLILIFYILILCYTWGIHQENKKNGRYDVTIPSARLKRLTKMVLVLVGVFVVSSTPYQVIQLVNLNVTQPTTTYFIVYYISICLSYASSSINPFLYMLLSGNFRRRLTHCAKIQMKVTERKMINIESTVKSSD